MKSLLLSAFLFCSVAVFAQNDIKFSKTVHQFGKMKKGVPATYVFTYTNNAAKPVVIEFANEECGYTKHVYSKAPTVKGKSGTIKVTYNAEAVGVFKKRVDVKFAHSNQPYILTIEGEVVENLK